MFEVKCNKEAVQVKIRRKVGLRNGGLLEILQLRPDGLGPARIALVSVDFIRDLNKEAIYRVGRASDKYLPATVLVLIVAFT